MLEFAARLSAMACDVGRVEWGRVEVRLGQLEGGYREGSTHGEAGVGILRFFPASSSVPRGEGHGGAGAHLLKLFLFNLCERSL